MGKLAPALRKVHDLLLATYGPQHWWPGETPFEIMAGTILTQAASWGNAEKAIANLKRAGALSPQAIRDLPMSELATLLYPSGCYNAKAEKLKALAAWLGNAGDRPEIAFGKNTATLRKELLAVHGIGPETADSILLYAATKPVFVIDTYTRRIIHRLGLGSRDEKYDVLQQLFMGNLPVKAALYNEYHALLVRLGKEACRTTPHCDRCTLAELCPKKT
ncbi:MAG: endonuclease [Dehalococcoidia bacterium]|nr:endonuclease [Dehalococcoidia bacterium]